MCRWARLGRERRHCIIRLVAARVVYRDRRGRPAAVVHWRDDRSLAGAGVRTPTAGWIVIEPHAGIIQPWGVVDRLWQRETAPSGDDTPLALLEGATPLTVATATHWTRPIHIPVVAEPGRLPSGAGTAVLNLVALLARDRGVLRVTYEGPYPTEALFLSLLECFDPEPDDGDVLARFIEGTLAWRPRPFEPCFDDELYVQRRGPVEKVVHGNRTYWREGWGRVRRWAPLRVDDDGPVTRCALWALGRVLGEHVRLDADGRPITGATPPPQTSAGAGSVTRPVAPAIRDGLLTLVVAMSAPPLAQALCDEAATLAWTVGHVDRDLVRIEGAEARIGSLFAAAIAEALADGSARTPEAALAMLAEIATALGDGLRARAQARLAAAPEDVQRKALAADGAADPDAARRITRATRALMRSGRVDDEPDVERAERRDRHD
jgi:hypothetical protein